MTLASATRFYAGILAQGSSFPEPDPDRHIKENELGFYLDGKGLTVVEIIRLKAHLVNCKPCQTHLREADAIPESGAEAPGLASTRLPPSPLY